MPIQRPASIISHHGKGRNQTHRGIAMSVLSKKEHEEAIERIMHPPSRVPKGERRLWSKDEINLLKKLYHKKSAQYIANKLNRSLATVNRRAHLVGITKKCIAWSSQEERLLKKLWGKKSTPEIAKIIGRSVIAITVRAHKLKLG